MELSIKNIQKSFYKDLKDVYDEREVKSLFEITCESVFGLSRTDILIKEIVIVNTDKELFFNLIVSELKKKKPIQYILKEAHFYERFFEVNKHVLIPRQETEELVQLILNTKTSEKNKILDVGTGTGIIPITLSKEMTNTEVYAIDISNEAIKIAEVNSKKHNAEVSFKQMDVLNSDNWKLLPNNLDIIVSNPPYVLNHEKALMHQNVLDYEPHLALFVEDTEPLLFYKKITSMASLKLKKGGMLYFEINEMYGKETADLLDRDFKDIKIKKDLNGKDRFVYGIKK